MVFISQAIGNQLIKNITLEKGEMTNEKFSKLIGLIGVLLLRLQVVHRGLRRILRQKPLN